MRNEGNLVQSCTLILKKSQTAPVTVETLLKILAGRGKPLIIIFLTAPFCFPIQIPGLSTPFGLAIGFLGLRIAFGNKIWLPKWILKKKIPKNFLRKFISKSRTVFKVLSRVTHPRWPWFDHSLHILHGLFLALLGFILALPLPIPLSNIVVAWAILLICIGLAEEDGLFVFLGYLIPFSCLIGIYLLFFRN